MRTSKSTKIKFIHTNGIAFILAMLTLGCQAQKVSSIDTDSHITLNKALRADSTSGSVRLQSIDSPELMVVTLYQTVGGDVRNDSGFRQSVTFTIDPALTTFTLNTGWFSDHQAFLVRHCRCIDAGPNKLTGGSIKGTKTDAFTWHIEANVTAEGANSDNEYLFNGEGTISSR